MSDLDLTSEQLIALLPVGHRNAMRASDLAEMLNISTREVGALVADLIENEQWLIGSTCSADQPGYFLVADLEDLEVGTRHIVARAKRSLARVGALKRAARERFSEGEVLRLFDLDEPAGLSEAVTRAEAIIGGFS